MAIRVWINLSIFQHVEHVGGWYILCIMCWCIGVSVVHHEILGEKQQFSNDINDTQNDPQIRQNWPHHIERQREIHLKRHEKHQLLNGINYRKMNKIDHITLRDKGKIPQKSHKNCNNTSRIKHNILPFYHFLPNLINFDQFRKVPRTPTSHLTDIDRLALSRNKSESLQYFPSIRYCIADFDSFNGK